MNLQPSCENSMSNAGDPTQHLKELLNVGKSPLDSSAESTPNGMDPAGQAKRATTLDESRKATAYLNGGPANQSDMSQEELPPALPGFRNNVKQNVVLHGDDSRASFPLYGQEIIITPSGNSGVGNAATASSQVKVTPVVKYDWESKYYIGNMVAVNKSYVVYVLKLQTGYGVRVMNRRTSERCLLKGFKDTVVDLAFSHYNSNLLACVERTGSLTIWKLYEQAGSIIDNLILSVLGDGRVPSDYHRVIWGPYLPEDPSSGEPEGSYLGVAHDSQVELWDVDEEFLDSFPKPVSKSELSNSYIVVENGHEAEVTDLAVAPDGTVIATASMDGTVKFWNMVWESADPPRRLHRFQPHEGRPVSSLLFCDNHKTQDPSVAFWRFLLTGAEYNSEIKLWCTVSWKCLQVVRFLCPEPRPCLKVCLDQSASFLMASDIKRKVFYILKLYQDSHNGQAHFSSLSEFILNEPMLNFCVATAGQVTRKPGDEEDAEDGPLSGEFGEDGTSLDNAGAEKMSVLVKMFSVFTRALQELHVRFQPLSSVENDYAAASASTTSREDIALQDGLSDMSFSATEHSTDAEGSQPDLIGGISPARPPELQATPAQSMTSSFTSESTGVGGVAQPFLMTPDALRSMNQKDFAALQQLRDSGGSASSASSFTQVTRTNVSLGPGDIMSPQPSSAGDGSITITPNSLQEASPDSSRVITPSQVPLPPSTAGSRDTSLQGDEEADSAPKSPPNTPENAREGDLNNVSLSQLSATSAEDLAERLHGHPRLEKKRLSDSSAEVAQILGTEDAGRDMDGWEDREGDDDTPLGGQGNTHPGGQETPPGTPPLGHSEKEVMVGDLVDLSFSPRQQDRVVEGQTGAEGGPQSTTEREARKVTPEVGVDRRTSEEEKVASATGHTPGEQGHAPPTKPHMGPVHPPARKDPESSSASGSESESAGGDARKEMRRRKPRGSLSDSQTLEEMRELRECLNQIMAAQQMQHEDVKKLRQDFSKSQQSNSIIQSMKSRIEKLEKSINTRVDNMVAEQSKAERQRLDTVLQERQRAEKPRQDQLMETVRTSVKQAVGQAVSQNLGKVIQKEVMPEISNSLSGLSATLSQIAAEKMTVADQQLKENIGKLIKNRNFSEAVAQNTAQVMSTLITQSYRDNFYKNVVPAFDNACKNMFQQMAGSFQKGTDTCVQQMQKMMQEGAAGQKQDSQLLLAEIRSLVDMEGKNLGSFQQELEKNLQETMAKNLQSQSDRLKKTLGDQMQRLIMNQIQPVLKEHQDSVHNSIISELRSQASTPVPHQPDIQRTQTQIRDLIGRGAINEAFQVALNAADLRALMFACNEVEVDQVFSDERCALEQPVLLSLIHQLSHDLTTNTDLKISYLDECMMAIEEDSPVTKGHLPSILNDLVGNIDSFLQSSPPPIHQKKLRRIRRMATKASSSKH